MPGLILISQTVEQNGTPWAYEVFLFGNFLPINLDHCLNFRLCDDFFWEHNAAQNLANGIKMIYRRHPENEKHSQRIPRL